MTLKLLLALTKAGNIVWTDLSEKRISGDVHILVAVIGHYDVLLQWYGHSSEYGKNYVHAKILCNGYFLCHSNKQQDGNELRIQLWNEALKTAITRQDLLAAFEKDLEGIARQLSITTDAEGDDG